MRALIPRCLAHIARQWISRVPLLPVMLILPLFLGSCSQVVETSALGFAADHSTQPGCRGNLGSYNLPKTYLRVQIARLTVDGKPLHIMHGLNEVIRPDNNRVFCLDYLASATSHDQVKVKKSKTGGSSQLLQLVASEAFDQSALIIRRLIRTVFIAIGNGGFRKLSDDDQKTAETIFDVEYDPFDVSQTAHVNETIREFGFCLVLENFSYGPSVSAQQYCQNPTGVARKNERYAAWYADFQSAPIQLERPGIVYRPRTAYQLRVYTKVDPKGTEPWRVRKTEAFKFENISPVLSVRVDRATFAKRTTALVFVDGMLQNVCITKTSELEEFVAIPLDIVKSIARLPTEIIQIQYDQISASNQLIDAEKRLVLAQQRLIAAMYEQGGGGSPARPEAPGSETYSVPSDLAAPTTVFTDLTALSTCPGNKGV